LSILCVVARAELIIPGQYAKCPATVLIAEAIVRHMREEDAESRAAEEEFRRAVGCVKYRALVHINGVAVSASADCVRLDGPVAEVYEVKRFSSDCAVLWSLVEKFVQAALYAAVVERAAGKLARVYVAVYTAGGGPYVLEVPRSVVRAAVEAVGPGAWRRVPFKHIPCSLCEWRAHCPLRRPPKGRVLDPELVNAVLQETSRTGLRVSLRACGGPGARETAR